MDGADRVGSLNQHLRRPERVVQVEAVGLEFGGEAPVEDQRLGEGITIRRRRFTQIGGVRIAAPRAGCCSFLHRSTMRIIAVWARIDRIVEGKTGEPTTLRADGGADRRWGRTK